MILVIGSTGNIGQQLVKQLDAAGQKVRALTRDAKKALSGKNVEAVVGDLAKPETLDEAFSGVDAVFVVTPAGEDMVKLEKNAYDAAKKHDVKHVVQLSVAGAGGENPAQLARWHAESETHLKASGLGYTILRPTMFMQYQLANAGSNKGEGKIYAATKNGHIALIDVGDIAASAAAVLTSPAKHNGKTYCLTGPEALTQAELAAKIGTAIGKTVTYVDIPTSALVDALKKKGFPELLAKDIGVMSDWFASDGGAQTSTDVETITGRKPRTFDAFIADAAGAFK